MKSRGTCTTVADSLGNLLFYSRTDKQIPPLPNYFLNGDVYNSNDTIMDNGDSIVGNAWYNEHLVIPDPIGNDKYYLFSAGVSTITGFYYSKIDLSFNGGLGKVTQKNIQLMTNEMVDVLAAVKHGNGRDWWIICKKDWYSSTQAYSDTLTEFLVTPNGISSQADIKIGSAMGDSFGVLKFNNAGNKLLLVSASGLIETYDFNRCTGAITNPFTIQAGTPAGVQGPGYWGAAFSPNDSLLYVSAILLPSYVIQFNLFAPNVAASIDTLGYITPSGPNFNRTAGAIKSAPDGKVYIALCLNYQFPYPDTLYHPTNMYLATIDSPNVDGPGCHFDQYGFYLGGKRSYWGLPNNPNYEMGAWQGSVCDTLLSLNPSPQERETLSASLTAFYHTSWQKLFVNAQNIKGKNCLLQIFDVQGKLIYSNKKQTVPPYYTHEINCEGFSRGIYFVELQTEKEKLQCKFIKQ